MTVSPFSLTDKTILITGASSGIGRAAAVECSRMGAACCIVVARSEDGLKETASMMDESCNCIVKVCDLSDYQALGEMVESLPKLDGVVCNAGINKMQLVQFYNEMDIDRIFTVNCFSPMMLIKLLIKKKRLINPSSVVFTASISGYSNVSLANGIYGASKSALSAFMRYAALELASRGIRLNAVHPGRVETPLIRNGNVGEEAIASDMATYPLKRYGRPEEVAYAIIYLLSDASAWVTGTSMVIDGGKSLV
ncbi:MAG: SDR family oxidoreductase [Muribaculaceae bacterium]|nr:SDR family oxidoreductase [Muribaculaceae bacterium]MDE6027525.1 SDR family oxidoreductase [Muribaculaceae bacterium]